MARALKVFRTPIGFHDAYVAAPSQKAALEAWGIDANLFARGMADVVTDPALIKEPLANPGQVIKRARGTAAEHLAALPKSAKAPAREAPATTKATRLARPKPKPSRRKLEAAEAALEQTDEKYRQAIDAIRDHEEALQRTRHDLNTKRDVDVAKLQRKLNNAREDYNRAIDAWRDQ